VARGVEHCTSADEEAEVLVFEPAPLATPETLNTRLLRTTGVRVLKRAVRGAQPLAAGAGRLTVVFIANARAPVAQAPRH